MKCDKCKLKWPSWCYLFEPWFDKWLLECPICKNAVGEYYWRSTPSNPWRKP